tara:strand:+ start:20 stop:331 length:312 start_codon:yes stop_codon:yes gene_type:complete
MKEQKKKVRKYYKRSWTFFNEKDYLKGLGSYREDAPTKTVREVVKLLDNAISRYVRNDFYHEFEGTDLSRLIMYAEERKGMYKNMSPYAYPYKNIKIRKEIKV